MKFLDFLFSLLAGIGTKQMGLDHPPVSPGQRKGSWILVTIVVVAGTLQAVSKIKEGQQLAANEKYNADVAEAQSNAIGQSASFEQKTLTAQAELEQSRIRRIKGQTAGTQRARFAKSGVRLDVGSPLEVQADTAAQFELDLDTVQFNLETGRETIRFGKETQQAQLTAEASFRRTLAKTHKTVAFLRAGSTLLTTVASAGLAKQSGGFAGLFKKKETDA